MNTLSDIQKNGKIALACPIDSIIGGGIEKGIITQFYGPPGSGKTNIALKMLVQCAKNGKKAVFIDTEGGLSIERMKQITGDQFDDIAGNIIVLEPTTFEEQDEAIKKIEYSLKSGEENIDLIILDSAVALYRLKDGGQTEINRDLSKQMGLLSMIARKYNIAVVVTNHIYSIFDEEGVIEPVGGTILKYWSKIIIELVKDENGERFAILKRHRSKPDGLKVKFEIVNSGLR
ncbi:MULTISPECIES: DNA repair and recombination protein RadB [Methanobacterium]|uniref:DNA repair and recombination protein RadB n=1 Tax=Methanobacterium veterum TaxID=408577 RepID=A0A9E5DI08_9EURY|nr:MULTISPECIES: DNA repair and recombination protein RadB [Methanobacterium]MCZ3364692.1 DNA repair and recombination protein RadB [Methanobacterium veterum]MCZ3372446.1 DNA repair and recombination protein RadB [Methanobacterium veterum]